MSPLLCRSSSTGEGRKKDFPGYPVGFAHEDLGDIPFAGVGQYFFGEIRAAQGGGFGPQLLGQPQVLDGLAPRSPAGAPGPVVSTVNGDPVGP